MNIEEFPQTTGNLTEASQNLYELIKSRSILAYPDENLRRSMAQAVAVETSRGWRIAKDKSAHKIDAVVALAQACLAAIRDERDQFFDPTYSWVSGPDDAVATQTYAAQLLSAYIYGHQFCWEEIVMPHADYDDDGDILKDGESMRVPMYFCDTMDAAGNIVETHAQVLDGSQRFHDGMGGAVGFRPGYVFDNAYASDAAALHRAQTRDFAKAELSAAWKGGLAQGDRVQFDGRMVEVLGHNDAGQVRIADASAVDAGAVREKMYAAYDAEVSALWSRGFPHGAKAGDACAVGGAEGRLHEDKDGKLVCIPNKVQGHRTRPARNETERDGRKVTQRDPFGRERSTFAEPSENEWKVAGPVSDGQSIRMLCIKSTPMNL